MQIKRPSGMFAFTVVWIGQAVSLLGTEMTAFALTIWAYELTGKATALALAGFFHVTPLLIFSPIAGAIVDRSNRKLMMMLSDLGSGVATIGILVLFMTGQLEAMAYIRCKCHYRDFSNFSMASVFRGHHDDRSQKALRPGTR